MVAGLTAAGNRSNHLRNPGDYVGFRKGYSVGEGTPQRRVLVARRPLDSLQQLDREPAFSAPSGGWGQTPDRPRHSLPQVLLQVFARWTVCGLRLRGIGAARNLRGLFSLIRGQTQGIHRW